MLQLYIWFLFENLIKLINFPNIIDANVIFDVLCDRADFVESSSKVWKLCEVENMKPDELLERI